MVYTPYLASYLVISFLGAANAGYLTWKHYAHKNKPLICPLNHDCSVVTESKWSHFFGIRNEILGLFFFIGMFVLGLGVLFFPRWLQTIPLLLLIGSGIGVVFSAFLVFVQAKIIKEYCFYCLVSAFLTLLLFGNSVLISVGI